MKTNTINQLANKVVLIGLALAVSTIALRADPELPDVSAATFTNPLTIDNPYWPLVPGTSLTYLGESTDPETGESETEVIFIEVLHQTRTVMGIETRVVRDRVYLEELLIEDTFDWYAQDDAGNVWYMGEEVTDFEYDDDRNLIGTTELISIEDPTPEIDLNIDSSFGTVTVSVFNSSPGTLYSLETSTNLIDWQQIVSDLAGTGGDNLELDGGSAGNGSGFFRVTSRRQI